MTLFENQDKPDEVPDVIPIAMYSLMLGAIFGVWQESVIAGFFMLMLCFILLMSLNEISEDLKKLLPK